MTETISNSVHALILAAGKGTRMNSELPKVLHELANKPMIEYVLEATLKSGIQHITVVVGHQKDKVENTVKLWNKSHSNVKINFHTQEQQLGTGHAVLTAEKTLKNSGKYLIVLLGDVPLIRPETISECFHEIIKNDASMLVITTTLDDPAGYGRIIHNEKNEICDIREEKEATEEEKQINEINTGVFLFKSSALWKYIHMLNSNNSKNEYYLTDMVKSMIANHEKVITYLSKENIQFQGINSPDQLKSLEKAIGVSV
ncbi:MAG: sugar phosphate nucleotidyltransferase [Spirochaetia bacterium]|nr:sugar phosphate nucleotidyltransferase [Spirochaetia bacterium]